MATAGQGRRHYSKQLGELRDEILAMGSMVEKSIDRAVESHQRRDTLLARRVIEADRQIDRKQYELEERALTIIATQQPMAGDLQGLAAALFIVGELERMGDYAEGIARIALVAADERPIQQPIAISHMAGTATEMLQQSLDAFMTRDLQASFDVWYRDDELDVLYQQIYHQLVAVMTGDPATIERATHLLWVAHNLERIGDRATNIAERTAFIVTGDARAIQDAGDARRLPRG